MPTWATDTGTRDADAFGTNKHGFTEGEAGVTPATIVRANDVNSFLTEINLGVERFGSGLQSTNQMQLTDELIKMQFRSNVRVASDATGLPSTTVQIVGAHRNNDIDDDFDAVAVAGTNTPYYWNVPNKSLLIDGDTFTATTFAGSDNMFGVARNTSATTFVAVGENGAIESSTTGITWSARTADGGYSGDFNGVAWAGTLFIAGGDSGEIQTGNSTGTTWTQRTSGTANNITFVGHDLTATVSVFMTDASELFTSLDDGVTWTARTVTGIGATAFTAIRFLYHARTGYYLIFGEGGGSEKPSIIYSSDGVNWTFTESNTPGSNGHLWGGILDLHGLLVAFVDNGNHTQLFCSANALTWYLFDSTLPGSSGAMNAWDVGGLIFCQALASNYAKFPSL